MCHCILEAGEVSKILKLAITTYCFQNPECKRLIGGNRNMEYFITVESSHQFQISHGFDITCVFRFQNLDLYVICDGFSISIGVLIRYKYNYFRNNIMIFYTIYRANVKYENMRNHYTLIY